MEDSHSIGEFPSQLTVNADTLERPAGRLDIAWAYFSLTRGIISRITLLFILWSIERPGLLAIVLIELIVNNVVSCKRNEYFPLSLYQYYHIIHNHSVFTGDFTADRFPLSLKLRLFIAVLLWQISVPVSIYTTLTKPEFQYINSKTSGALLILLSVLEYKMFILSSLYTLALQFEAVTRITRFIQLMLFRFINCVCHCGSTEYIIVSPIENNDENYTNYAEHGVTNSKWAQFFYLPWNFDTFRPDRAEDWSLEHLKGCQAQIFFRLYSFVYKYMG
jgi:hypothetical protein